jgi:hypothetical protein
MKCKFCGCTDERACMIPMLYADTPRVAELVEMIGDEYPVTAKPGQLAEFSTPCHWSAPNICSAPACIDQAYVEACAAIDRVIAEELAA